MAPGERTPWARAHLGPRVFIGSSSEGLDVARAVSSLLSQAGFLPNLWNRGAFEAGETYMESLERVVTDSSFALLILTPDDIVESRGQRQQAARDNILFELGLFIGALGRRRALMVVQKGAELRLPSDLLGVSVVSFERLPRVSLLQTLDGPVLEIEHKIRQELSMLDSSGIEVLQIATCGVAGYLGGGTRRGVVATAVNGTDRGELFVASADESLLHSWEKAPGGAISDWSRFGENVREGPSVFTADGKTTVVYVNTGGQLCIRSQTGLSGSWGKWSRRDRSFTGPISISMTRTGPSVFAARGRSLIQVRRTVDGTWSAIRELGKAGSRITDIRSVLSSSARGEVLLRDDDGRLWHSKELEDADDWAEFVKLDGPEVTDGVMVVDNDGLTVLLAVVRGGGLVFRRQRHARGDHWGPWADVPVGLRWSGLIAASFPSGFMLLGQSPAGTLQIASLTTDLHFLDLLESDVKVTSWDICEGKGNIAYATNDGGHLLKIDTATLWPLDERNL